MPQQSVSEILGLTECLKEQNLNDSSAFSADFCLFCSKEPHRSECNRKAAKARKENAKKKFEIVFFASSLALIAPLRPIIFLSSSRHSFEKFFGLLELGIQADRGIEV